MYWIEKIRKSTWFYRRVLPFLLLVIWIGLTRIINEIIVSVVILIVATVALLLFYPWRTSSNPAIASYIYYKYYYIS